MAKESRKAERVDAKGVYHGAAHIGPSRSVDGQKHSFPFSGKPKPQPQGWTEVDYEAYLAGFDLALNAKVQGTKEYQDALNPEKKAGAKLSPEEKERRKAVRKTARVQKDKDAAVGAGLKSVNIDDPASLKAAIEKMKAAGLL